MITLIPITPANASVYKSIRLRALQDSPTAFGTSYAQASQLSDADWLNRAVQCAAESSIGYLAMDAHTPVGIARTSPDAADPAVAWVESMWVAPSHRRHGVGRQLIHAILVWSRARNLQTLKLAVTSNNQPALRFYQSLGFSLTGKTEPYPNDPALVECEMSRAIC